MTDEELEELLAEAWDSAIEEVDEAVRRMEDCIRKYGLTAKWRRVTGGEDKPPEVRYAADTEAHVIDGRYYSVYNPFLVDSTSLRYEHSKHENAHHVYHAENNGAASTHHPRGWKNILDNITSNASVFCRGGG